MSEPFIGEIRIVGFNFAPQGWALCNGQLLAISQNTALFSLLGTFYGGDGRSSFRPPEPAIPRARAPGHGHGPLVVRGGPGRRRRERHADNSADAQARPRAECRNHSAYERTSHRPRALRKRRVREPSDDYPARSVRDQRPGRQPTSREPTAVARSQLHNRPPGHLPGAKLRNEERTGTVELRPAAPSDEPFLRELDGGVAAERLGQGGLDPDSLATLVEMQVLARRRDRAASYPDADEQLIMLDGRSVGAVLVDRSRERILIIDLALTPDARQRGIATTVLAGLAEEAVRRGIPLRATTQSTNVSARRLYARAGFREVVDDGLNVSLERQPS